MKLFPFYYDITDTRFLVVGGGEVAAGKISRLTSFTDKITVVAPEASVYISELCHQGRLNYIRRTFEDSDLENADCVISATGDRELNRHISELCRQRKLPVNAVDDPENCTFFFPAMIRKGPLTVSISTDGASPSYAGMLKREIAGILPENIDQVLEIMHEVRSSFPEDHPDFDQKERAAVYKRLLAELLARETMPGPEEKKTIVKEICREVLKQKNSESER